MADNTRYAFIGSSASLAGGPGGYSVPEGYGGILVAANDPKLQDVINRAHALGIKAGIFIPTPNASEDPETYAQHLAQVVQKYGPDVIMPDLEAEAKGYPGSPQWDWNQRMSDEFHRLAPDAKMSVTVMGNQDDFNYGAYTKYGVDIHAQAYGSDPYDPSQQFNSEDVYKRLLANGVPPELAHVVVAPGQKGVGAGGSVFTIDEMQARGKTPTWADAPAPDPATAPAAAPGAPVAPGTATSTHPGSPAAEAYAKRRLMQMQSLGILPEGGVSVDPSTGGYAQAWRNLSATLGPQAQAAGYRNPGFWLRQAAQQGTPTPTPGPGLPSHPAGAPAPTGVAAPSQVAPVNSPYFYGSGPVGVHPTPSGPAPMAVHPSQVAPVNSPYYYGSGPAPSAAPGAPSNALAAARAAIMAQLGH